MSNELPKELQESFDDIFKPLNFEPAFNDAVIYGVGLSVYEMKDGCITVTNLKHEDVFINRDEAK